MKFKTNGAVLALLLVSAVCGVPGAHGGEWKLAGGGLPSAVVIISPEAGSVELHAAKELCHFLGKVTGAEFRSSESPVPGKFGIWLGTPETNPLIMDRGLSGRVNSLSEEGFLLHADAGGLVIAGRNPVGVLFGTYAFLEEHIGMRWFFPGDGGEYRPDMPELRIGRIDEEQNPAFEKRLFTFGGAGTGARMVDSWNWIARNRMSSVLHPAHLEEYEKRGAMRRGGGHVLSRIVPDELFDEHPEYFGMYGGERRKLGGLRQPCTTNPGVVDLAVEYIMDWLSRNPGGTFTLNNNDYPRFCECDDCVALDPPEETARGYGGRITTRFFKFKNEVAARVWEKHPDAKINTLAYQDFRLPPLGMTPDPRLKVTLCDHGGCYRHSLDDPECRPNQWFRDMFEGWAELPNPRSYYTYYGSFTGYTEFYAGRESVVAVPLERIVSSELRYMHRLGHTTWRIGTTPPDGSYIHHVRAGRNPIGHMKRWRANMPAFYLQAKLAWDPGRDIDEIIADMNEKFYGPAAGPMAAHRELLLDLWEETPGCFMYKTPLVMTGKSMMAPNAVRDLTGFLDAAEAAAEGSPVHAARVSEDREIFEMSWVRAHSEYKRQPAGDIEAARRTGTITVDGRLDEKDWMDSGRITGFVRRDSGGELAEAQTFVRLLYDDEYLYIGMEMEEPDTGGMVTLSGERDSGAVFRDNNVEIFIDPCGEARRYVHIAVNAGGVFRDSVRIIGEMEESGNPDFDSGAEVSARVLDDRWTLEIKLPAGRLGGEIREGGRWKMDIGRVRRAGGEREISSWTHGAFHLPESFRSISFEKAIIKNGRFDDVLVMDTDELFSRHGSSRWEFGNDPPVAVMNWRLHHASVGRITVLTEDVFAGENAVRLDNTGAARNTAIHQRLDVEMTGGEKLLISFAARGKGALRVNMFHYTRVPGERGVRAVSGIPTSRVAEFELDSEWRRYEVEYRHPGGHPEVATLALYALGEWAALDDVYVVPGG